MTGAGAAGVPQWADDPQSPDFRHLAAANVSASADAFELAAGDLDLLCRLNRFAPKPQGGVVLFGLRGCRIVDGRGGAFVPAVKLVEARPDHNVAKCVLGVWNQPDATLAVFPGSTVPNAGGVIAQHEDPKNLGVANLLGSGLHGFAVGIHLRGKPKEIRGVFVEHGRVVVVLRALEDVVYRVNERWQATSPGDNIHPSRHAEESPFSSEGCQTVVGTFSTGGHGGPWATFRARAGLAPQTEEASGPYAYVLLTGREAHLASSLRAADPAKLASFARLRFGSSGDTVKTLQAKLGRQATGTMDAATTMAWVERQRQRDHGAADGIVTPADATALGCVL